MDILIVSLIILLISYFQIKKLRQQKHKKELYVFLSLMIIASYLSLGQLFEIYIPNPTNGLRVIFSPFNQWIIQLMS